MALPLLTQGWKAQRKKKKKSPLIFQMLAQVLNLTGAGKWDS